MKKKRIVMTAVIAAAAFLGGFIKFRYFRDCLKDTEIRIESSDIYTPEEINSALEVLKKYFRRSGTYRVGSIRYADEDTAIFQQELKEHGTVYGWDPGQRLAEDIGYGTSSFEIDDVIIFYTDYTRYHAKWKYYLRKGNNEETDYQFMLIRGPETDGWQICWGGCGYG